MHYHPKPLDFATAQGLLFHQDPRAVPAAGPCHCGDASDPRERCGYDASLVSARTADPRRTVVCGRGKGAYLRPGNVALRALIRRHLPAYLAALNKFQKGIVIQRILFEIQTEGLVFVRKASESASDDDAWLELGAKERRDKVGHAIREAVAEHRHQTKQKQGPGTSEAAPAEPHTVSCDDTVSTAHSQESVQQEKVLPAPERDLHRRRSRFDRMLESLRLGQQPVKEVAHVAQLDLDLEEALLNQDILTFFQI